MKSSIKLILSIALIQGLLISPIVFSKGITPTDVIADGKDTDIYQGYTVRKGTIKAVIENVSILESSTSTSEDRQDALNIIKNLSINVAALGLTNKVTWKNTEVEKIMQKASVNLKKDKKLK